jgi:hypothetical protein
VIGAAQRLPSAVALAAMLTLAVAIGGGASWAGGSWAGGSWAASAGEGMLAGYGEIRAAIDGRPTRSTLEEDDRPAAFEEVLIASCGAGNRFECGLLHLWRAVAATLSFLERLVTLGLIAFLLPWLLWTNWRHAVRTRRRRARMAARGAATPAPDAQAEQSALFLHINKSEKENPRRRPGS